MNIIQAIQNMSSNSNQLKRWIEKNRTLQDIKCITKVSRLFCTLKALVKNKHQMDLASL